MPDNMGSFGPNGTPGPLAPPQLAAAYPLLLTGAPTTAGEVPVWDGTEWVPGSGGSPSGPAGGALTGTYPNPTLSAATIASLRPSVDQAVAISSQAIAGTSFTNLTTFVPLAPNDNHFGASGIFTAPFSGTFEVLFNLTYAATAASAIAPSLNVQGVTQLGGGSVKQSVIVTSDCITSVVLINLTTGQTIQPAIFTSVAGAITVQGAATNTSGRSSIIVKGYARP